MGGVATRGIPVLREEQPSRPAAAGVAAGDAARVEQLEIAVRALETRVAALEASRAVAPTSPVTASPEAPTSVFVPEALPPTLAGLDGLRAAPALAGRALIALAGAYLIRALAESSLVPTRVALALGLAYAAAWLLRAHVEAARGRARVASLDTIVVTLIAFPLAGEAALRFGVPVPTVALLLVLMTAGVTRVAARDRLAAGAWAATLAATAVAAVLAVTTHGVEALAWAAVATGIIAYTTDRALHWTGLAWPAALGADLLVLAAAFVALQPAGPPEGYSALFVPLTLALVLALPAAYLGAFAIGSVFRGSRVRGFELAQGAMSLAIVVGLAEPLGRAAGMGNVALGTIATAGTALAAATGIHAHRSRPRDAAAFAAVAFVLGLAATGALLPATVRMPVWAGAAILAATLARGRGGTFAGLSFAALVASGMTAGILSGSVRHLARTLGAEVPSSARAWAFALAAAAVAALLAGGRADRTRVGARTGAAALAVLVVAAEGVALVVRQTAAGGADAGGVAAVRSVVIASMALMLAMLARRTSDVTARWLMRAVLAAGAVKLVVEDLPHGRAVTLVIGLAAYGAALLLAPAVEGRAARDVGQPRGSSS